MSHSSSTTSMPICRICQLPSMEPNNPLLSPCRCLGSIRYVHSPCLKVTSLFFSILLLRLTFLFWTEMVGSFFKEEFRPSRVARLCRIGRSNKPLQEHWPCESTVAAAISWCTSVTTSLRGNTGALLVFWIFSKNGGSVAGLTENMTKPSSWGLAELGNNIFCFQVWHPC